MQTRTAYVPLETYPESAPDDAILTAVDFAAALGCTVHVSTFAASIPQISSPLGRLFLDVPGLVHTAEEKSRADCLRLHDLVRKPAGSPARVDVSTRQVLLGAVLDAAAAEARCYDLSVVPWFSGSALAQDMAQAIVFGSGRPTILVPPSTRPAPLDHIAIAWDGSRVAARALWDAIALLPENGRLTVLTIHGEKPLTGPDIAQSLASSLEQRGCKAGPLDITLGKRTPAEALQDASIQAGAQMLAMGGFGHSRLRDFILGGATKGVLNDLRMPVLLSH